MAKISQMSDNEYVFHCPGCKCGHAVRVNGRKFENGAGWQWNGSVDARTFSPSLLIHSSEFTELGKQQYQDWINHRREIPGGKIDSRATVCHSFITDGMMQFLPDCTHDLAGKTVAIPEWE
jgi:hypothetical protein